MNHGWFWIVAGIALSARAPQLASAAPGNGANVVLLTLDGVRWEEVFRGVDPGQSLDPNPRVFEFLTGPLAAQGMLVGDRARGESVRVANRAQNSLPGYQSIMAGATQPCGSNLCGRIRVETFPERLLQDLDLRREQIATIASWDKIANAVEHVEGTTTVNAGNKPLLIGRDPLSDEDMRVNEAQAKDTPPWDSARWDKYTFAHAMHYLREKQPRFLFISLNDSDEWGHKRQYDRYLATLRQHDAWIKELVTTLDSMGEYGRNTTLIITTDHGRGTDNEWSDHGAGIDDSANIWLYARSPRTLAELPMRHRLAAGEVRYTHLDIRPTIEAAFGLEPKLDGVSPLPGRVISSVIPNPPAPPTARRADRSRPARRPSRAKAPPA